MALIDTGSDVWLEEYESCERLYSDIVKQLSDRDAQPRGSDKFNGISATVRIHLSQFNIELSQLDDRLKATSNITDEERERRQRLIEDLQSKFIHLTKMYKTNPEKFERRKLFGEPSWQDDDESDVPLLGTEMSVQDIKDRQRRILAEQDRGLENLSTIIGRQKNIANTISVEVEAQNEIIDDISARMDATTAGIRGTTTTVTVVSRSDSTWWYWLTIILLFFCIIGLVLG
uniref:Syntaxin-51 n=1 Tax=Lygus hesperus TaxID=30085 RepID=A0A0K8TE11_LYGHE